MNLKLLKLAGVAVALAAVGAIVHAQSSPIHPNSAANSTNCAEFAEQTTPADLAQEIAQVEVERVLSGVRYLGDHPMFAYLQAKQFDLETCLARLQSNDDQNLVAVTTVNAMESKIAELEVQYARDQAIYHDNHPIQQSRRLELEALHQYLGDF